MSKTHQISLVNWTQALATAIGDADSGDTIEVDTEARAALGESARKLMWPEKVLKFRVVAGD